MGLGFLDRTLRTTGVVLLIFLPFGLYYLGVYPTLAAFSGGVWGLLNLIFISALVRSTIRPEAVNKFQVIGIAVFKFPLLYGSGYFLTQVKQFDPLYLLAGFSLLLVVIVLRAIGAAMMQAGDKPQASDKVRSIA
ncbi:MAG: hypothetical protein J7J98_07280 [candidate division Zixibacteria bacterium]|nr:hypothetical protein [candidate division Zixibacteria bacterium]